MTRLGVHGSHHHGPDFTGKESGFTAKPASKQAGVGARNRPRPRVSAPGRPGQQAWTRACSWRPAEPRSFRSVCVHACGCMCGCVCLCVCMCMHVCAHARVCVRRGARGEASAPGVTCSISSCAYAVCCFVPLSLKHDSAFHKEQDRAGRSWSCSHSAMCPEPVTLAQPGHDHCRAGRKLPMAIKQPRPIQGASAALQSASDASFEKPSLTAPPTVTSASRSPFTWLHFLPSVSRHLKLHC